jgi:shikimate kinase
VIVLLAGPIAVGKTSLAEGISESLPAELIRVRVVLSEMIGVPLNDRRRLQIEGAAFDIRTGGRWLLNYLQDSDVTDSNRHMVVDALRTIRQTEPLLLGLSESILVYLAASEAVRAHRYRAGAQGDPLKRDLTFRDALRHETEARSAELASLAHIFIETDGLTAAEVLAEVMGRLSPPSR